jgi:putative membrane protein
MSRMSYLIAMCAAASLVACSQRQHVSGEPSRAEIELPATDAQSSALGPDFLQQMVAEGRTEIEVSRMATRKASNPSVRAFANMMMREHEDLNAQLVDLAHQLNVGAVPPLQDVQRAREKLVNLFGVAFDRAYMNMMVVDCQQSVDMVEQTMNGSSRDRVQVWAARSLPELRQNLKRAEHVDRALTA